MFHRVRKPFYFLDRLSFGVGFVQDVRLVFVRSFISSRYVLEAVSKEGARMELCSITSYSKRYKVRQKEMMVWKRHVPLSLSV